jgi:hypothetical protein
MPKDKTETHQKSSPALLAKGFERASLRAIVGTRGLPQPGYTVILPIRKRCLRRWSLRL